MIGQSEKPQTIIIPTGSLGEMSEARIKILEKTLESKLDDHFAIVPKVLIVQVVPSEKVRMVPLSPTVTKSPFP